MRHVLLPAVLLLAIGCGSSARKIGPGLQARTNPLDDASTWRSRRSRAGWSSAPATLAA
jgi:hypothetical protein